MKQNNYTELLSFSFIKIHHKNAPPDLPDPPDPKSGFVPGFFKISHRSPIVPVLESIEILSFECLVEANVC